jgi:hypothetical protein
LGGYHHFFPFILSFSPLLLKNIQHFFVSLSPKQLTLVENQEEYSNYGSTALFQTRIPRILERMG